MPTFDEAFQREESERAWELRHEIDAAFDDLPAVFDQILGEPEGWLHRHIWIGVSTAGRGLQDGDGFRKVWMNVSQRWRLKYDQEGMTKIRVVLVLKRDITAAKKMECALLHIARKFEANVPRLHVCNRAEGGQGIRHGLLFRMLYVAWVDKPAAPPPELSLSLKDELAALRTAVGDL
jgi:hypothetical protein